MRNSRRRRLAELSEIAETGDWEQVYRRFALWEFPSEVRMGFQLAFLRPFAVPRMADVLLRAGSITQDPEKRAYHTGIVIHELIVDGLEGPRGRRMVAHMNRRHRDPHILQEDLTYVLCAFIVVPVRYAMRVGWRPVSAIEREASLRFYQRMGALMNIRDIPATYEAAAAILEHYERRNIAPSAGGLQLGRDVIGVLRRRLPAPLRPLAEPMFTSQLADERLIAALGLTKPGRTAKALSSALVRVRRKVEPLRQAPTKPSFYPGQSAGRIYPHGYTLDQVEGKDAAVTATHRN